MVAIAPPGKSAHAKWATKLPRLFESSNRGAPSGMPARAIVAYFKRSFELFQRGVGLDLLEQRRRA
jgi:hypothetical protein